jgi:hypothetical protein
VSTTSTSSKIRMIRSATAFSASRIRAIRRSENNPPMRAMVLVRASRRSGRGRAAALSETPRSIRGSAWP